MTIYPDRYPEGKGMHNQNALKLRNSKVYAPYNFGRHLEEYLASYCPICLLLFVNFFVDKCILCYLHFES